MLAHDVVNQISQSNEELSLPELLFREWIVKRITEQEYHVGTAVWVAEHLDQYPCRLYPPLSSVLRDYVHNRAEDRSARDAALSYRLGQWLYQIQSLRTKNEADVSSMAWCLEKLTAVKLTSPAADVALHAKRFALQMPEGMSAALMVQAKDSFDRQREERGRR